MVGPTENMKAGTPLQLPHSTPETQLPKPKGAFDHKPVSELPPVPLQHSSNGGKTNPPPTRASSQGGPARADVPPKNGNDGPGGGMRTPAEPVDPIFGNLTNRQPDPNGSRTELKQIDGKWYETQGGRMRPATGDYFYAVQDGRLFVSRQGDIEASNAKPVKYAGQIQFTSDGSIAKWDNRAPNYNPATYFANQSGLPMDKFAVNNRGADAASLDDLLRKVQRSQRFDNENIYRAYSRTDQRQQLTPRMDGGRDVAPTDYLRRLMEVQEQRPAGTIMTSQNLDKDARTPLKAIVEGAPLPNYNSVAAQKDFFHYSPSIDRTPRLPITSRIYINANIDRVADVTKFVISEIVDKPADFPGVREAKVAGPARAAPYKDNIVIYVDTPENRQRILNRLAQYQQAHPDHFKAEVPAMTKTIVPGIAIADEPNRTVVERANRILMADQMIDRPRSVYSFGEVRSYAIELAHRDTIELRQTAISSNIPFDFNAAFNEKVRLKFAEFGIDPDQPSRNLSFNMEAGQTLRKLGLPTKSGHAFVIGQKVMITQSHAGVEMKLYLQHKDGTLIAGVSDIKNLGPVDASTGKPKPSLATARAIKSFLDDSTRLATELNSRTLRLEGTITDHLGESRPRTFLEKQGFKVDPQNQSLWVREMGTSRTNAQLPIFQKPIEPHLIPNDGGTPRGSSASRTQVPAGQRMGAQGASQPTSAPKTSQLTHGRVTVEYVPGGTFKVKNVDLSVDPALKAGAGTNFAQKHPVLTSLGSFGVQAVAGIVAGQAVDLVESHYKSTLQDTRKAFRSKFPDAEGVMRGARIEEHRKAYDSALQALMAPNRARDTALILSALPLPENMPEELKKLPIAERVRLMEKYMTRNMGNPIDVRQNFIKAREAYFDALEVADTQLGQLIGRLPTEYVTGIRQGGDVLQSVGRDLEKAFWRIIQSPGGMFPMVYYPSFDLYMVSGVFNRLGAELNSFADEVSSRRSSYLRAYEGVDKEFMQLSNDMSRTRFLLPGDK